MVWVLNAIATPMLQVQFTNISRVIQLEFYKPLKNSENNENKDEEKRAT